MRESQSTFPRESHWQNHRNIPAGDGIGASRVLTRSARRERSSLSRSLSSRRKTRFPNGKTMNAVVALRVSRGEDGTREECESRADAHATVVVLRSRDPAL